MMRLSFHSFAHILLIGLSLAVYPHILTAAGLSGSTEELPSRPLKILTWNIYMLPHCNWIHENNKRARAIAAQLVASDYDILLFEEAFDHNPRKILLHQLRQTYPYVYGPINRRRVSIRTNSGLWILSKIPLRELQAIEFRKRYGIDAYARKGAAMFEGIWQNQPFQLLCTHLQSDNPDSIRRAQCLQISNELLKQYSREDVPQIICGDFNIERDDPANYPYMLSILDSRNGKLEGNIQTSFDEIDNSLAFRPDGKKRLIDYILVRNLRFIRNIKRQILVYTGERDHIAFNLSDHYGVAADIQFNPVSDPSRIRSHSFFRTGNTR